MAIFTSDNREMWQQLANDLAPQRPSVGKCVRITSGKYTGKEGIVIWHRRDKFANTRYCTDAALHLRDMEGRRGFRVRVDTRDASFFVSADKVEVIDKRKSDIFPCTKEA